MSGRTTSVGDDWTLPHLAREQAARFGERIFMTFEHGEPLRYAALDARSDALAAALAGSGVAPGDRVMALVKNRIEFILAMFAVMKAGAVFVPINTELKGAFLRHQLRNAEPRVLLVDGELLDAFDGIERHGDGPAQVVLTSGTAPPDLPPVLAGAALTTFGDLEAAAGNRPPPTLKPKPGDIGAIMYTSGTTGPAKGVLMPHGHLYLFGLSSRLAIQVEPEDVYYVCMPAFHANALFIQILSVFFAGARAHLVERFSPNRWLDEVIACGATLTNALGVMPEFIFNTAPSPRDRAHTLRRVMAVPIGRDWGDAFVERFGVPILQGFGMTECNMPVWGDPDETELIPGCAGYVEDAFFEVRIVNPDTDRPLPAGEIGEIVVRPKQPDCFFAGYHQMPERTVEAWRNLWFHTGDAGRFDDKGRLHYIDRIKDCIRRRGENISAFEVEQVLNGHPEIAESAVIGVKVAGAGGEDEVMAIVVPADGAKVDPVALLDFCVARMPRFAVPRFIDTIPALDKTASGKLRKQDLRDAGIGPRAWDRESIGYTIARR